MPAGVTGVLSAATVNAAGSVTLALSAAAVAPAGSYPITITATSATVPAGGFAAFTATVATTQALTGLTVPLRLTGLPPGITAALTPTSVLAPGASNLRLRVDARTAPGAYAFTLTSSVLGIVRTETGTVVVEPGFGIAAAPDEAGVLPGSQTVMPIYLVTTPGFIDPVTLSVGTAPPGIVASAPSTSLTASGVFNLTLGAAATAAPGEYAVPVLATAGSVTRTLTARVIVQGFSLTSGVTSRSVTAGQRTSFTATLRMLQGYSAPVDFRLASPAPNGVTVSLAPGQRTTNGNVTLAVTTGAQTPAGTYALRLLAESGGVTRAVDWSLQVLPDYRISLAPASIAVRAAATVSATVNVTPVGGFNQPVTVTIGATPPGVTAALSPNPIVPGVPSSLTISASAAAPGGTFALSLASAGAGLNKTQSVNVTVRNYALSLPPGAVTVARGASGSVPVSITPSGGFVSPVRLQTTGLPNGITAAWSVGALSGGGTSTLTLSAAASAVPGTYSIRILAISGTLQQEAALPVIIQ